MTLVNTESGEAVADDGDYLEQLASRIRVEHVRTKDALRESVDAYFIIGACLLEARELLRSDNAFGAWFREQQFGFTRQWAYTLRLAAENEGRVRQLVTTQVVTGSQPNIKKAVKEVRAALTAGREQRQSAVPLHSIDRSPKAKAARRETIIGLADTGMTSEQIASQLGISGDLVRKEARDLGVSITADAVVPPVGRRVDSNIIVDETVNTLDALLVGMNLVDFSALDSTRIKEWDVSLGVFQTALNRFRKQLNKETSQ